MLLVSLLLLLLSLFLVVLILVVVIIVAYYDNIGVSMGGIPNRNTTTLAYLAVEEWLQRQR